MRASSLPVHYTGALIDWPAANDGGSRAIGEHVKSRVYKAQDEFPTKLMRIPFTMNHIRLTSCRAQGRFAREQLPRAWPCHAMCAIWVNEFEELWRPDDRFSHTLDSARGGVYFIPGALRACIVFLPGAGPRRPGVCRRYFSVK
jgi:hypothetical protein